MTEQEWRNQVMALFEEVERRLDRVEQRLDGLEALQRRTEALEAHADIVTGLMTQVADMLDDWQALRERIVAGDEARLRE